MTAWFKAGDLNQGIHNSKAAAKEKKKKSSNIHSPNLEKITENKINEGSKVKEESTHVWHFVAALRWWKWGGGGNYQVLLRFAFFFFFWSIHNIETIKAEVLTLYPLKQMQIASAHITYVLK